MNATEGRIRLTLLGGFLGSGKTTWLRHQLRHGRLRDAWVVVNEAAEMAVDDAVLGPNARTAVLAGGCACCDGRQGLIALLRGFCDRRVGSNEVIDHIVLETSGLADPAPIVAAIRSDPILVHHILVAEIIVAVDALHGIAQLKREPLGRRQIEAADRLIVTKIDEAAEGAVRRLLAMLHLVNPGACVSGAILGSATALPEADGATAETLPELSGVDAGPIRAMRLNLDSSIDWTAFSVWLSALLHARGEDVMRVKGVVRTPAGRLLLQSVRKIVQSPEILPDATGIGEDNSVVFIGRGFTAGNLQRSLRYFTGIAAS
jgi:G3E family GTPase